MSSWMMTNLVKEGKVVVCLPDWKPSLQEGSNGDIYAAYHGSKYPRPALRAFIDFLIDKIKESNY